MDISKATIIEFFLNLTDERERDYELKMTKFVNQYEVSVMEPLFLELLKDDSDMDISYKAFYCLNIMYRMRKDYRKLQSLMDDFSEQFKSHITLNHLKALFLIESDSLYDYSEILTMTYNDTIEFNNNAGFVHLFADVFATIVEGGGVHDKDDFLGEWYQKALGAVNHAIELDPEYAKYYCTKARILAINSEYIEAEAYVNKAISYENSSRKDYALRINQYQFYKMMIINDSRLSLLETKIWYKLHSMLSDGVIEQSEIIEAISEVNPNIDIKLGNLPSSADDVIAYKGSDPYIFISYAHRDKRDVETVVNLIQKQGFNVWFDEGLIPGEEYAEELAKRIKGAFAFVLMISANSIHSEFVRKELTFAFKCGFSPICVFLKETTLSGGVALQLDIYEHMYWYQMSEDAFLRKLVPVLNSRLESKIKAIYSLSNPGGARNEDIIWTNDEYVLIMDGSTSLKDSNYNATDFVKGFVNHFDLFIKEGRSMVDAINSSIDFLYDEYKRIVNEDSGIFPSAAGIIVHVLPDRLEVINIGDCTMKFIYDDGSEQTVRKNDVGKFDNLVLDYLKKLHDETKLDISELMSRPDVKEMLISNRKKMNKPDGYRIFSFDMTRVTEEEIEVFDYSHVKYMYLHTDGFNEISSKFGNDERDADSLLKELRIMENEDSGFNKYPRFKMSDDASVIKLQFAHL